MRRPRLTCWCVDGDKGVVQGWLIYSTANSGFNTGTSLFLPTLIVALAEKVPHVNGEVLYSYMTAAVTIVTVAVYLSVSTIADIADLKRSLLFRLSAVGSLALVAFIFTFAPASVILACGLFLIGKIAMRVADICHDALLPAVASLSSQDAEDNHSVSVGGTIVGYVGLVIYAISVAIIIGICVLAFGWHSKLWVYGIIPLVFTGLWVGTISYQVSRMIPPGFGACVPYPAELGDKPTYTKLLLYGLLHGTHKQWLTFKSFFSSPRPNMPCTVDLGWFVLAQVFFSDASSTAQSVAVIIAVNDLGFSYALIVGSLVVGLVCAITGLFVFKYLTRRGLISPKNVIVFNVCVLCVIVLYVLRLKTVADLFVFTAVSGSQVGSFSAFSRSVLSTLIPQSRLASVFSFYEVTQKGTAWIGPIVIAALTTKFGSGSYRRIVVLTVLIEAAIAIPMFVVFFNPVRGALLKEKIDQVETTEATNILSNSEQFTSALTVADPSFSIEA